MKRDYRTRYSDTRGTEATTLSNDGANLSLELRGVRFSGRDFDMLAPDPDTPTEQLQRFTLGRLKTLCGCTLECKIPILVFAQNHEASATLEVHLELGSETSGATNRELLSLTLRVQESVYSSAGTSGWFEDELLSLQRSLPQGSYIKACIACAYSDYSPYGHGLFGGMACFRRFKEEYASVRSKDELFLILEKAEVVQETYLCGDFKKREPHTGYRG